jgi:hypothetical protein
LVPEPLILVPELIAKIEELDVPFLAVSAFLIGPRILQPDVKKVRDEAFELGWFPKL